MNIICYEWIDKKLVETDCNKEIKLGVRVKYADDFDIVKIREEFIKDNKIIGYGDSGVSNLALYYIYNSIKNYLKEHNETLYHLFICLEEDKSFTECTNFNEEAFKKLLKAMEEE